ncbi:purine-nucleoside phosphorylase [Treponema pectinovorum]|uniref:purine-nucleoside phosphorylase n=1 Tax=Treponema pectinovorum TaxID=164 RepID=UPI0011F2D49C|nr:purine-nucleoside phosphorylase [Treponema pectinovorum]
MSTHINAPEGAIAKNILLPGDPLRAKFIAENFLENPKLYNEVRGMLGFTGTYKGVPVSVQGTGMGQPSLSIYVTELFKDYGVENAIRVGTCGAIQEDLELRDTIIVNSACSDSSLLNQRFENLHFAPTADFSLVKTADRIAQDMKIRYSVGSVASSDFFYDINFNWKNWAKYGVKGIEMESAELFTLAAQYKRRAMAIMTVSDHILKGTQTTAQERQTSFTNMMSLALQTIVEINR